MYPLGKWDESLGEEEPPLHQSKSAASKFSAEVELYMLTIHILQTVQMIQFCHKLKLIMCIVCCSCEILIGGSKGPPDKVDLVYCIKSSWFIIFLYCSRLAFGFHATCLL